MYKFYVCEFRNKVYKLPDSNKVFVKFGVTHHQNVLDRFNPDINDGYAKNYGDWEITCKFSIQCQTKQHAEHLERHWLNEVFPNPGPTKVWVERYLNADNMHRYDTNTGITELRLLTLKQAKWVYYNLHQSKRNPVAV